MKKSNIWKDKEEIYVIIIYLLVACAILANFSQLIALKYKFGNFNFGEMIIVMFNDSYTGFFTFPFMLGFVLMIQSPVEQNIFFLLTRYSNRKDFYRQKHYKALKTVTHYIVSICIFCIITGIGNSDLGINISPAAEKFSEVYLLGSLGSKHLIFEIVKVIILQGLLLYFFTLIYLFLTQFKISQSVVFIIYSGILVIMAGMTLGFFGETVKAYSLFSIASSVYGYGLSFIARMILLGLIDIFLLTVNFKIFEKKDIVLAKGSKQYQNE